MVKNFKKNQWYKGLSKQDKVKCAELRAKQKKKRRPDAALDAKKDIEEGRLLYCSLVSKNLGHKDYIKVKGLASKMRWIYNLKKMLDNKQEELVFVGGQD